MGKIWGKDVKIGGTINETEGGSKGGKEKGEEGTREKEAAKTEKLGFLAKFQGKKQFFAGPQAAIAIN